MDLLNIFEQGKKDELCKMIESNLPYINKKDILIHIIKTLKIKFNAKIIKQRNKYMVLFQLDLSDIKNKDIDIIYDKVKMVIKRNDLKQVTTI